VPAGGLLHSLPTLVGRVAGKPRDMEWIPHRQRVRLLLAGGGLEPGERVHRDNSHHVPPDLGSAGEPLFQYGLGSAFEYVQ
jgi:hypothetical protein